MGWFDWLRRKPPAEPAAASPSESTTMPLAPAGEPAVPCAARIAAFDPLDAVGMLELPDGEPLRFGRSACRGFEPLLDLRVTVRAVAPRGKTGWRATELGLDDDRYDERLRARDAALGVAAKEPASAAAVSQELGWIVVLLDEPVPSGPQAFAAWAQRHGLRARSDGAARLVVGDLEILAYPGDAAFPADQLASLGAADDLDPGGGFLGLSLGVPGFDRGARAILDADAPDPWAPDGRLRALSRLVLQLLDHGRGIVLPQAGRMFDASRARVRLAGTADPNARPFGGWIAWAVDAELRLYATYGMALHGLPDVQTTVDPDDPADLDRACAAILFACHHMVWSNAALVADEIVEVPVGVAVGAHPIAPSRGPADRYRVRDLPDLDDLVAPRRCLELQRIIASA